MELNKAEIFSEKGLKQKNMEIRDEKNADVLILSIIGRLDTTNFQDAEKIIMGQIEKNENRLVIDCEKLDYISSSGLRILLMGLKKTTALKGKFILCSLQDSIREIFDISGFTSIFEIHSDRQTALDSIHAK
jgi:anti-anti-sigma factor